MFHYENSMQNHVASVVPMTLTAHIESELIDLTEFSGSIV